MLHSYQLEPLGIGVIQGDSGRVYMRHYDTVAMSYCTIAVLELHTVPEHHWAQARTVTLLYSSFCYWPVATKKNHAAIGLYNNAGYYTVI